MDKRCLTELVFEWEEWETWDYNSTCGFIQNDATFPDWLGDPSFFNPCHLGVVKL